MSVKERLFFFEEQTLNVCTPPNIFYRAPLGFLVNFVAMSPYLHARRLCCRELPVFTMTIPSHCTTPTLLFLFAMFLSGAAHLLRVHDKIFRPVLYSVSRRAQRTNPFTSYNSEIRIALFLFLETAPSLIFGRQSSTLCKATTKAFFWIIQTFFDNSRDNFSKAFTFSLTMSESFFHRKSSSILAAQRNYLCMVRDNNLNHFASILSVIKKLKLK